MKFASWINKYYKLLMALLPYILYQIHTSSELPASSVLKENLHIFGIHRISSCNLLQTYNLPALITFSLLEFSPQFSYL